MAYGFVQWGPGLLTLLLRSFCLFHSSSMAFQWFQDEIPNGNAVHRGRTSWPGVGHNARAGSGPRNAFGAAFNANGKAWTQALCMEDSDNDGESNGMELGDPDCTWSKGQTPSRVTSISHPGFADSTTSTESGLPSQATNAPTTTTTTTPLRSSQTCFAGASDLMLIGSTPYDCFVSIGGGIEIHWTPYTSTGMIDFTLRRQMTDGYMALAVTDAVGAPEMDGGEAVVITPNDWNRYTLGDGSISQQGKAASIPFTFTGSAVTQENGWVEFRVTGADLASMTKYNVPTNLDVSVPLIWSKRDSGGIGYHGSSQNDRNGFSINFASGASRTESAGSGEIDDVEMHGILQISAWTFIAPLGIFLKRLGAKIPAFQKVKVPLLQLPLPYVLHVLLMVLTVVLSFWGFLIAKDKFDSSNLKHGHGATATITIVLALSQPLPAVAWQFFKPAPESPRFKVAKKIFSSYHPFVGAIALLLGTVTVFTGIANYDTKYQDDDKTTSFRAAALAGTFIFNGAAIIFAILTIVVPGWFPTADSNKVTPVETVKPEVPAPSNNGVKGIGVIQAFS